VPKDVHTVLESMLAQLWLGGQGPKVTCSLIDNNSTSDKLGPIAPGVI